MINDEAKKIIDSERNRLRKKIEDVCNLIDRSYTANTYQLFTIDGYKVSSYRATKALNSRLKFLLRQIPALKVISKNSIFAIIFAGMKDVQDKYSDCGADDTEARYAIEDAIDKLYENLKDEYTTWW